MKKNITTTNQDFHNAYLEFKYYIKHLINYKIKNIEIEDIKGTVEVINKKNKIEIIFQLNISLHYIIFNIDKKDFNNYYCSYCFSNYTYTIPDLQNVRFLNLHSNKIFEFMTKTNKLKKEIIKQKIFDF